MKVVKPSREAAPWVLASYTCQWCKAELADIVEDDIVSWYEVGDPPLSQDGVRYGIRCPECRSKIDLINKIPRYVMERNNW